MDNELHEACGVFGALTKDPEINITEILYHGLNGLQHRGQESAGMIISDGITMKEIKGMGLVNHAMTEKVMNQVSKGKLGIAHTRYSTQGSSTLANCQPILTETADGTIALAHNGQLINKDHLKNQVLSQGIQLSTDSDSEIILKMIATARKQYHQSNNWVTIIQEFMDKCSMAYSFVMMTHDGIYGVRDPYGNRPLCIGILNSESDNSTLGWIISSESSPFLSISAKYWREVQPGEIVAIKMKEDGSQNFTSHLYYHRPKKAALCIFEYVYFSRSDTILENQMVYSVRYRCGQILAIKAPADGADIVSCIPDSSIPAALGYSSQSKIPYVPVLNRNIYVGRTFIQPLNKTRKSSVRRKFGLLTENVFEKKIVLIDDSIVRGNTITPIIQILKASGAKEVHIRIASPPVRFPCFMGIDIPTQNELITGQLGNLTELAERLNVDSIEYQSHHDLLEAIQKGARCDGYSGGYCSACFTGEYPVALEW